MTATTSVLESWTDAPARTAIVEFVQSVTEPGERFVPVEERIAVFDKDGTLWCEKPMYPQADFIFRRLGQMVAEDPSLGSEQPWKAVVEQDRAWLGDVEHHIPELLRGVGAAYSGITTEAFEQAVREFFDTAVNPALNTSYLELAYAPMRELLAFLADNDFAVYICSGGGRDFVRVIAAEMYGLPRDRIIGSGTTLEFHDDGHVYRTAGVEEPIDDGAGKPVHIWQRTGLRPLLAGGNADGDLAMLSQAELALVVHHDDAEREFSYDAGAERVLAAARSGGWTVVSIQRDFGQVFATA